MRLSCSVGRCKADMAEMCVKAVLAVADLSRKDVNLDLIKVELLLLLLLLLLLYVWQLGSSVSSLYVLLNALRTTKQQSM